MENSQSKQGKALLEHTDFILKLLTRRGLLPDEKITDENRRAAMQKRQKDCYHNTELLLRNYRNIAWMVESFPETIAEELDRPFETIDKLLIDMEIASTFGDRGPNSRTTTIGQSRLLLDRMNEALTVLKHKPENGQQLYDVLYLAYIAPQKLQIQEQLYRLDLSSRQYYRFRKEGITIVSLRLWSSPDPVIDLWMELLEIGR